MNDKLRELKKEILDLELQIGSLEAKRKKLYGVLRTCGERRCPTATLGKCAICGNPTDMYRIAIVGYHDVFLCDDHKDYIQVVGDVSDIEGAVSRGLLSFLPPGSLREKKE